MALLELKNVNVRYIMKDKKVHACQHVSLEIEEQDSIGIVGESGSGKSTLASAVLRLLPHRITQVDGEILYNGKDLLKLTKDEMDALRWTDLSIVFQKSMSALSPVHKVGAVSYTHLDVYKRQGYERPAALTRRKPGKFSLSDSVEVMYNRGR